MNRLIQLAADSLVGLRIDDMTEGQRMLMTYLSPLLVYRDGVVIGRNSQALEKSDSLAKLLV